MSSQRQKLILGKTTSKIGSGSTPRGGKNAYNGGDVALIRSLNVHDGHFLKQGLAEIDDAQAKLLENVTVNECDVLFNITGASVARCCVVPKEILPARVNQHVAIIRTNPSILNPYYLQYYLILPEVKSKLLSASGGSSREAITKTQLEELSIEALDIQEQDKAANVLRGLDKQIEINSKIEDELTRIAKLLYEFWFLQFDFPNEDGMPYRSSGGSMKFSKELKREIPASWEVLNLLEVVKWIGGAQPPKSTFLNTPATGYVRFIQNRDYADNRNLTYIPIRDSNKLCLREDIMMDKYGDAGLTRFGIAGAYNVALSKIKVNLDFGQEYIRKFLESESTYTYLHNACLASTRASLNEDILGNLYIAIPEVSVLKKFEAVNKAFLRTILLKRDQSEKIVNLRDWLMPMIINGQARVKS